MTKNRQNEMLQNLFAAAMDAPVSVLEPLPAEPQPATSDDRTVHPADDDDLLLD